MNKSYRYSSQPRSSHQAKSTPATTMNHQYPSSSLYKSTQKFPSKNSKFKSNFADTKQVKIEAYGTNSDVKDEIASFANGSVDYENRSNASKRGPKSQDGNDSLL